MWIQHPRLGAFSVVLADDLTTGRPDPTTVMIRARTRRHLELLQAAHPKLAGHEILQSPPQLDYRFRLVCRKEEWAAALSAMALELDYRNVKSAAHAAEDQVGSPFVRALHRVHADLEKIQRASAADPE